MLHQKTTFGRAVRNIGDRHTGGRNTDSCSHSVDVGLDKGIVDIEGSIDGGAENDEIGFGGWRSCDRGPCQRRDRGS